MSKSNYDSEENPEHQHCHIKQIFLVIIISKSDILVTILESYNLSFCDYLELCGGIELGLNGIELHPEVLLIHLDGITAFPLDLLLDQHLAGKKEERISYKYWLRNSEEIGHKHCHGTQTLLSNE